ncbi:hypothetical protein ACVWWK_008107 [Bradyrhizobium sp. LB9.1b]
MRNEMQRRMTFGEAGDLRVDIVRERCVIGLRRLA